MRSILEDKSSLKNFNCRSFTAVTMYQESFR